MEVARSDCRPFVVDQHDLAVDIDVPTRAFAIHRGNTDQRKSLILTEAPTRSKSSLRDGSHRASRTWGSGCAGTRMTTSTPRLSASSIASAIGGIGMAWFS